ncbi:unnamed protein product [Polarella glacialis]|uniref:V-ATPase proteolipid subunit C-like domain-containing protein n=1 Tax=Polarella glacialis TaxID=89957 RepID=A0A813J0L3_POLGL|nr:unnamed protein product [Polarella glacialis]
MLAFDPGFCFVVTVIVYFSPLRPHHGSDHHKIHAPTYSAYAGYAHLAAGLTVGLRSLAAGMAIGVVGDAGVRANAQQPKLFVGMILILIFAEALGLYGLIVGLVVASTADSRGKDLCAPWDQ